MSFTCPCCGFPDLSVAPYAELPGPPAPSDAVPPYEDRLGPASYEVCSCCGFEFGFDDNPGASGRGDSFEAYRAGWLDRGAPWFAPSLRPPGWDVDEQLVDAGLAPSRTDQLVDFVAIALEELLDTATDDGDLLRGHAEAPGTPRQRFGMGLDGLLGSVLRSRLRAESCDDLGWLDQTDGLAFALCRRTGTREVEVIAMWHVGLWDNSANSPWLVPVLVHLDLSSTNEPTLRLSGKVGERDPRTGSLVKYERESRAASHRAVTISDDPDTVDWYYEVSWP